MAEPQYYWQAPERRSIPFSDIPEEAFEQSLEDMIEHLESLEQGEAAS